MSCNKKRKYKTCLQWNCGLNTHTHNTRTHTHNTHPHTHYIKHEKEGSKKSVENEVKVKYYHKKKKKKKKKSQVLIATYVENIKTIYLECVK